MVLFLVMWNMGKFPHEQIVLFLSLLLATLDFLLKRKAGYKKEMKTDICWLIEYLESKSM